MDIQEVAAKSQNLKEILNQSAKSTYTSQPTSVGDVLLLRSNEMAVLAKVATVDSSEAGSGFWLTFDKTWEVHDLAKLWRQRIDVEHMHQIARDELRFYTTLSVNKVKTGDVILFDNAHDDHWTIVTVTHVMKELMNAQFTEGRMVDVDAVSFRVFTSKLD